MQWVARFISTEVHGAKLLLVAACLGLYLNYSPWANYYNMLLHSHVLFQYQHFVGQTNLYDFVNHGLMTFFFLMVGLEIKFEFLRGALNTYDKALLPIIGAIGGMIMPALIYIGCIYYYPDMYRGWAIPTATDVAFSLSVLAFLSHKISTNVKTFLSTLAIVDDILAIVIIALFYTDNIVTMYLMWAGVCMLILYILNQWHVTHISWYVVVGTLLWGYLYASGVHPTLAGIAIAAFLPLDGREPHHVSPAQKVLKYIHPWVAIVILPLFAFVNMSLPSTIVWEKANVLLMMAVGFGLYIGKPIGVLGTTLLSTRLGYTSLPYGMHMKELFGVAILCGIGFTVSLFIGDLAFTNPHSTYYAMMKLGILAGSILSAVTGYYVLYKS